MFRQKITRLTLMLVFVSAALLLSVRPAPAQETMRPPFILKDYTLAAIAGEADRATLSFTAEMRGSGEVAVRLHLRESLKSGIDQNIASLGRVVKGQRITKEWEIPLPADGYYLAQTGLSFSPDETDAANREFTKYQSYPLYFEVREESLPASVNLRIHDLRARPKKIKQKTKQTSPAPLPSLLTRQKEIPRARQTPALLRDQQALLSRCRFQGESAIPFPP